MFRSIKNKVADVTKIRNVYIGRHLLRKLIAIQPRGKERNRTKKMILKNNDFLIARGLSNKGNNYWAVKRARHD